MAIAMPLFLPPTITHAQPHWCHRRVKVLRRGLLEAAAHPLDADLTRTMGSPNRLLMVRRDALPFALVGAHHETASRAGLLLPDANGPRSRQSPVPRCKRLLVGAGRASRQVGAWGGGWRGREMANIESEMDANL